MYTIIMHYRKIEKVAKAFANHRRIQILDILSQSSGLSVVDITNKTRANLKTVDVHINRLFAAGLVTKKTAGNHVFHTIDPVGISILKFLRKLE